MLYAQEVIGVRKVVMVIAHENFRDEEFFEPKEILVNAGVVVKVASSSLDMAKGVMGKSVKPDILVKDIDPLEFDAVAFIGGGGSSQYWDDPVAHKLAQNMEKRNKIVAAICIAPVTLAKAGLLKGKKATVWSSESAQLKEAGAVYTGNSVEKDGLIITAAGPFAAKQFGEEILKALNR